MLCIWYVRTGMSFSYDCPPASVAGGQATASEISSSVYSSSLCLLKSCCAANLLACRPLILLFSTTGIQWRDLLCCLRLQTQGKEMHRCCILLGLLPTLSLPATNLASTLLDIIRTNYAMLKGKHYKAQPYFHLIWSWSWMPLSVHLSVAPKSTGYLKPP